MVFPPAVAALPAAAPAPCTDHEAAVFVPESSTSATWAAVAGIVAASLPGRFHIRSHIRFRFAD